MPVDPATLSLLSSEYTNNMTRIHGRRVARLVKREFASAEYEVLANIRSHLTAVVGFSPSGAAVCTTNGPGKQASVVKWSYESTVALETQVDLYQASLPVLGTESTPLARLGAGGSCARASGLRSATGSCARFQGASSVGINASKEQVPSRTKDTSESRLDTLAVARAARPGDSAMCCGFVVKARSIRKMRATQWSLIFWRA